MRTARLAHIAHVVRRTVGRGRWQRRVAGSRTFFDPLAPPEEGSADAVVNSMLLGWARCRSEPNASVEVDVYADERFLARVPANLPRADVPSDSVGQSHNVGFAFHLPPAVGLCGQIVRVFAARSGLELAGSPLRVSERELSILDRLAQSSVKSLTAGVASAVSFAAQRRLYGRRFDVFVETDPSYPEGEWPVSRSMAYVNAAMFKGALSANGPQAALDFLIAVAEHFSTTSAGMPVGPEFARKLVEPRGGAPVRMPLLIDLLRVRAGLPEPAEEAAAARMIGLGLNFLLTRRLPVELLGREVMDWLAACRESGARWDAVLSATGYIVERSGGTGARQALARHIGLSQIVFGEDVSSAAHPTTIYPGVRLLAVDYGECGLTQNVRQSRKCVEALGFAHDAEVLSLNALRRSSAPRLDARQVALLHVQPDDVVEVIMRLPEGQAGQHLIGFFMWETERVPETFALGLRLVDEIWTGSTFCADVFRREAETPVHVMSHAVEPVAPDPCFSLVKFAEIGEPTFLVLTHFDARSWITRKNPVAVARAFLKCFPKGDEAARLIIKTRRAREGALSTYAGVVWTELEDIVAADPRIRLIDADLPAAAMAALMASSDVYVSLHRGEGFGYGPAEALVAGVPLIVSAFGGSLDFAGSARLVPCRRRALLPGEYLVSGRDQVWGEPDCDVAARHLGEIFADRHAARVAAAAARFGALKDLSLAALASRYGSRLSKIMASRPRLDAAEGAVA